MQLTYNLPKNDFVVVVVVIARTKKKQITRLRIYILFAPSLEAGPFDAPTATPSKDFFLSGPTSFEPEDSIFLANLLANQIKARKIYRREVIS